MNYPLAAPLDIPLDVPVALRTAERSPLIKSLLGHITTTAYMKPTGRSAPKHARSPVRVRQHHVEWVDDRLSKRDWAIMASLNRLRLATGAQLERLHFARLNESSRARVRRRVLARLTDWRVLTPLQRRIGGVRAGSSGLVSSFDSAGQKLAHQPHSTAGQTAPVRRPHTPRMVWLKHELAVTELYVELVEQTRMQAFDILAFATEPACWWPDGLGYWLKPDAYVRLATADYSDAWWVEQDMYRYDRHSEDLPTIRRKLIAYLDFVERGQLGPCEITPRVLISVANTKRLADIAGVIERLPAPASKLFHVTTSDQAVRYLLRVLHA